MSRAGGPIPSEDFSEPLWYSLAMNFVLLASLFIDDLREVLFGPSADPVFNYITLGIIIIFLADVGLHCFLERGYFLSFNFFVDVVSTAMLSFDLLWVATALADSGAGNTSKISRVARIVRIGSKISRFVRLIRLFRLLRLYRTVGERVKRLKQNAVAASPRLNSNRILGQSVERRRSMHRMTMRSSSKLILPAEPEEREEVEVKLHSLKETQLGREVNNSTQRRYVILVMCFIATIPIFMADTYFNFPVDVDGALLAQSYFKNASQLDSLRSFTGAFVKLKAHSSCPLLNSSFSYSNSVRVEYPGAGLPVFPIPETRQTGMENALNADGEMNYSIARQNFWIAVFNMVKTALVAVIMVLAIYYVTNDVESLVIEPLETMINTVQEIANNPLEAENLQFLQQVKQEEVGAESREESQLQLRKELETRKLQNLLIKFGVMLKVGFGEAGSKIVSSNLKNNGHINPLIAGQKVYGIFGFCSIREFDVITSLLGKDIMVFTNKIAHIVHRNVERWGGSVNKNIGEGFLFVWVLPEQPESEAALQSLAKQTAVRQTADLALYSFVKILTELYSTDELSQYRQNKHLLDKLQSKEIGVGLGLHFGWAIQGAIGSCFKIDASYLSPNVNLASRLEAATRQYGVGLLASGEFCSLLSPQVREQLRQVDRVTVKGSKHPMNMLTLDLNLDRLVVNRLYPQDPSSFIRRQQKIQLRNQISRNPDYSLGVFSEDRELSLIRLDYTAQFFEAWGTAFKLYMEGAWSEAESAFETTLRINGGRDKPSLNLLQFIRSHRFQAVDWRGFRQLKSK